MNHWNVLSKTPMQFTPKNESELFFKLFYSLDMDFAKVLVIWEFLADGADSSWIENSSRGLTKACGERLSYKSVQRAIDSLVNQGIVDRRPLKNYVAKYKINIDALVAVLEKPLPDASSLPGMIGSRHIPFLTRLQQNQAPSTSPENPI